MQNLLPLLKWARLFGYPVLGGSGTANITVLQTENAGSVSFAVIGKSVGKIIILEKSGGIVPAAAVCCRRIWDVVCFLLPLYCIVFLSAADYAGNGGLQGTCSSRKVSPPFSLPVSGIQHPSKDNCRRRRKSRMTNPECCIMSCWKRFQMFSENLWGRNNFFSDLPVSPSLYSSMLFGSDKRAPK